jgi:eukaryotic-like serine/threonine-protein kinase
MATDDGSLVWERRDQAEKASLSPAARDGVVYVNGKTLAAFRITDGEKIWSRRTEDMYSKPAEWGPVSVYGESVYAAGGMLPERLAISDGSPVWNSQQAGSSSGDSPILLQGTGLLMINDDYKTEVNAVTLESAWEGWTYELPEAEHHGIAVGGNRAFVTNDDLLCALPVF